MIAPNTGLTAWPENRLPETTAGETMTGRDAEGQAREQLRARLTVLGELESSLADGRLALLALKLAGMEAATRGQVGLVRKLGGLLERPPGLTRGKSSGEKAAAVPSPEVAELEKEIRRSARRVGDEARLQAALLRRAQSKLYVLANMLAGSSRHYAPRRERKWQGASQK